MSQHEYEFLAEPLSVEQPCGASLEDTQQLAAFDVYRLFGQVKPLDPPPDWREIKQKSLEALTVSKDIRLLAHLAAAALRVDGLQSFCKIVQVGANWLEQYFDQLYPLIEEDAILRKNALNSLADRMAIVDGLRRLPLFTHRQLGSLSLRSIEMATGQVSPTESDAAVIDQAQINAMLAAADTEALQALQSAVIDASAALKTIENKMREVGGAQAVPDLDVLQAPLLHIQRVLQEPLEARNAVPTITTESAATNTSTSASGDGTIRSRQDAIRTLDAVAAFFKHNEPSSPVPLFIERAKRLVAKDFMEVLADIAPDAVGQARSASGLRDE